MPIRTIRIIGRQASNEINILREKRNRSPNSFSARKDFVRNSAGEIMRGGNADGGAIFVRAF